MSEQQTGAYPSPHDVQGDYVPHHAYAPFSPYTVPDDLTCTRCGWLRDHEIHQEAAGPGHDGDGGIDRRGITAYESDQTPEYLALQPCPTGCECRVGSSDPDASECGCDGPCTTWMGPITPRWKDGA